MKDMIDLQASIYGYCGLEQLYNRMTEVFSSEGMAQLASRSVFGVIFELPTHYKYVRDPDMNTFCRAYHSAKMFSVILNFRI